MTFEDYQNECRKTDIYPERNKIECLTLGLASEVGEVAGIVKKVFRDRAPVFPQEQLEKEMGDVLWYVARILDECGIPFERMLAGNIDKLRKRKINGTLCGSGDER